MQQNAYSRWSEHCKKWNQFRLLEDDILVDYAKGYWPLHSLKWFDVDIVYVPINVWDSHFVFGVVHLAQSVKPGNFFLNFSKKKKSKTVICRYV